MDVEHRVKVLEDELKILKNQIQNTLLDIQGELSILGSTEKQAVASSLALESLSVNEMQNAVGVAVAPTSISRSAQANVREVATPTLRTGTPASLSPGPSQSVDLAMFARLLTWVKTTVDQVGSEAVRQALDVAATSGQLPAVMQASLQTLLPPADGHTKADIGTVLPVYMELNALLAPGAQMTGPVTLMEANSGG